MGDKVRVQELDPPTQELLLDHFKGYSKFARFGDAGHLIPGTYKEDADAFRNMEVRPEDLWVTTFPRSGTTLIQELVWLLKNDLDYDTALKTPLTDRYFFLGIKQQGHPELIKIFGKQGPVSEAIAKAPSPRFIKNHFPLSLLPIDLLTTAKVVYVARDPRDVAVSYYHLNRLISNYKGDFKTFWNFFINDLVAYTPFFSHLKEAWALRHHPHMLFIFYEDIRKDLPSSIKRIANFLEKEVPNDQIVKLCEHLAIENFRKNECVNSTWIIKRICDPDADVNSFVRKGCAGGWREWFDEEMSTQAQEWLRRNLADCDLRFPNACL